MKRIRNKRLHFLCKGMCIVCMLILFCGFTACTVQSPQQYYSQAPAQEQQAAGTAYIATDCSTVLQNMDLLDPALKDSGLIPEDGTILQETEYTFAQGDTVFDLLCKATKEKQIQLEYQGAQDSSVGALYVQGIGYLYEFSCGAQSGWSYCVNGEFLSVGCDSYTLKDGDKVQWLYTCDMGQDIGNALAS